MTLARGTVQLADILQPCYYGENVKTRPVVVWTDKGDTVDVVWLTTRPDFEAGGDRLPIDDWAGACLSEETYVWSNHLHAISGDQVIEQIGILSPADLDKIVDYVEGRHR